jgi:hypothetical protein
LASETEKESGVSDDVTDAVEQALTKAAEEILSLRQRVAGLEETLEKHGHVNLFRQNWIEKLEAELAALKAGQGEPVAWVSREFEGLVGWHISLLTPRRYTTLHLRPNHTGRVAGSARVYFEGAYCIIKQTRRKP